MIGFIGLGTMGAPMAGHIHDALVQQGRADDLLLNDNQIARAQQMLDRGAQWADTAREIGERCSVVICMVPAIDHVRSVVLGDDGLLGGVHEPTVLVVCSTVAAADVRDLAAELDQASTGLLHLVDAPVSGGEVGARAGTLSIMVGGADADVQQAVEVLQHAGRAVHLGPLGSGEVAKACNQIMVAANITAIAEASVVAERAGLDVGTLFDLLKTGYAGSAVLSDKAERFARKDYSPSGPLGFWVKDLKAYASEADQTGTPSLLVQQILHMVEDLVAQGHAGDDTAIVQQWIAEQRSGHKDH